MMEEDELEYIEKAKKGDAAAIAALYRTHAETLYRFIFYKVGNSEDAEDVMQDTMIAAFKGIQKFRGEASFRHWCYEIAKRKIADLWRKKYSLTTVDIETISEIDISDTHLSDIEKEDDVIRQEKKNMLIQKILDSLPENYKTILEYRFLKNYTIQESADAMNITLSNAKILQHRAIKKIRTLFSDDIL